MYYFDSRLAGIPCKVHVTYFSPGDTRQYMYQPPEDPEVEIEICDTRGRPAPWLEKKANAGDIGRLEYEAIEFCKEARKDEQLAARI